MSFSIKQLETQERKITQKLENFAVLEFTQEQSVSPMNASTYYYMNKMGLRKKQLIIQVSNEHSVILQAGAMQWIAGNVQSTTGLKGVGDLFGKVVKGAVTKESAIKPEYVGNGVVALEPTYKYIILQDVAEWGSRGMAVEDGMFLACDSSVEQKINARTNISSALLGNEGLFNLALRGQGVVALESNVPYSELIEVELNNDILKIDGSNAIAWSADLDFTVERSSKTLIGSMVNSEGLVNVFRGTGKVLMSPITAQTSSFLNVATNAVKGK